MARPSRISQDLINEICTRLSLGQPLVAICNLPHIPHIATVLRWLSRAERVNIEPEPGTKEDLYLAFRTAYERARASAVEVDLEKIREIERRMLLPSKMPNPDYNPKLGRMADNPKYLAHPQYIDPNTARVLIDSIKWRMGRAMPQKYGDVTKVQHSGSITTTKTPKDDAPDWVTERLALPGPSAAQQGPDGETVH